MMSCLHRIQYACNLPKALLAKNAEEYLTPCAPTLLVLGHMLYPEFFAWCSTRWPNVIYAPFGQQGHGIEKIMHHAAVLQPPLRLAYFLPKENVVFLLASNKRRNEESYQYWTYRGATPVLISKEALTGETLRSYAQSPAAHVFANGTAATNGVIDNTLSVCNPAFSMHEGHRVTNYDKAAFVEVMAKNEQKCEIDSDLATSAAAYMTERRPWSRTLHYNPYDPLK